MQDLSVPAAICSRLLCNVCFASILWQFAADIDILATAGQSEAHGASSLVQISLTPDGALSTNRQGINSFTSGSMTIIDIINVVVEKIGERVLVVRDILKPLVAGTSRTGCGRLVKWSNCDFLFIGTRVVPTRDPSKLQPSLVWLRAFGFCKVPDY
eukprot:g54562.t1